jgi:hypothetical protein
MSRKSKHTLRGLDKNFILISLFRIKPSFFFFKFLVCKLKIFILKMNIISNYSFQIFLFSFIKFYKKNLKNLNYKFNINLFLLFKKFDSYCEFIIEKSIYIFPELNNLDKKSLKTYFFLKHFKFIYIFKLNLFCFIIRKQSSVFLKDLNICYNNKLTKHIILTFCFFEKFCLYNRKNFEKLPLDSLIDLFKYFNKEKNFFVLIKLFFFSILIIFFLHKKNYIQDRFVSLSIIKSFILFFFKIYNILLIFGFNEKIYYWKSSLKNPIMLRKNNISPSCIRVFRTVIELISDDLRDFFNIINKFILMFLIKFLKKIKMNINFSYFLHQKFFIKIDDITINLKKIFLYLNFQCNNTKITNQFTFIFSNKFKLTDYKISKFWKKEYLIKKIFVKSRLKNLTIIEGKKILSNSNYQIYFAYFTKYIVNQFDFLKIIFKTKNEIFLKLIFINNLLLIAKKRIQEKFTNILLTQKFTKYYLKKLIHSKLDWIHILLSLSLNISIYEGNFLYSFFLSLFGYLFFSTNMVFLLLETFLSKLLTENNFLKRCSILVFWFFGFLYPEITILCLSKIFDVLLNFENLDLFTFLFLLKFFKLFGEVKLDKQKDLIHRMVNDSYFIILTIRLMLNHSQSDEAFIYIFLEESYYLLKYCFDRDNQIYKILKLFKKILKIEQDERKKENLSLLYFNYNFILLTKLNSSYQIDYRDLCYEEKENSYICYMMKMYLEDIVNSLLNSFNKISKITELNILKIFIKMNYKSYHLIESSYFLLLHFYFLSIQKHNKIFILLFLIELQLFLPFFFLKKSTNIFELFKFENYEILKVSFILYYYFLNNCYLKFNEIPIEKILYIKCKKISVQKYSIKLIELIFKKKEINSNFFKFSYIPTFISNNYLLEVDFKSIGLFFFKKNFLSLGFKFFISIFKQLIDTLKCKSFWKKTIISFGEVISSVQNLDFLLKFLYLFQKNIENFATYNEFIKILLKLKNKNLKNRCNIELILLEVYRNLKNKFIK